MLDKVMFFRLVLDEEECEVLQSLLPLIVTSSTAKERETAMYALGFKDIRKFVMTLRRSPQLLESFQIVLFLLLTKDENSGRLADFEDKIVFTNDAFERRLRRMMGWKKRDKNDLSLQQLEEMWELEYEGDDSQYWKPSEGNEDSDCEE
jgi:hypothetical protein